MIYDVVIIGGGPGGYSCAIKAAQLGLNVGLVEKYKLGGTCLHVGCIPTKFLLKQASEFKLFKELSLQYGLLSSEFMADDCYLKCSKLIEKQMLGIGALIKANKIDYFADEAIIRGSEVLLKGSGELLYSKNIIVASGSKPFMPSIKGIDDERVLTSDLVLTTPVIGKSIGIIGGGVIGVELANYLINISKDVTIIEMANQLIPFAPADLRVNMQLYLRSLGIKLVTKCMVEEMVPAKFQLKVITSEGDYDFDQVIVCAGRVGNMVEGLDSGSTRFIKVDESFRVKDNLYAIGDVNGISMLAHSAAAQGINVACNIAKEKKQRSLVNIPNCIYTDIELAYVGLFEEQLFEKSISYKSVKYMMGGNSKASIEDVNRGFIKILVVDDLIVGAQLFCLKASELISYFTLAIDQGIAVKDLDKTIFPHPSLSEGITEAIASVNEQAIHVLPKRR